MWTRSHTSWTVCSGVLRLDGTQTLFAIDGQHRVEGIKQALEDNSELGREEVSVIFVAHRNDSDGMERTRRLFTTLNRYAKPVSKSEIVALDEDDIVAITTRELVEKHPLFQRENLTGKNEGGRSSGQQEFHNDYYPLRCLGNSIPREQGVERIQAASPGG